MCKTHIQPANLQKLFGLTIKSIEKCTFLEVLSNYKECFLKKQRADSPCWKVRSPLHWPAQIAVSA